MKIFVAIYLLALIIAVNTARLRKPITYYFVNYDDINEITDIKDDHENSNKYVFVKHC